MTARLSTGTARFGVAAIILLLAGSAQALTFISPMGEPFRTQAGDKPPEEVWFERADKNNDGKITRAEFLADAGHFFMALDVNHNGEIGPEEIQHYEDDVAPEVNSSGFGDGDGHARRHGGGVSHGGNAALDSEGVSSSGDSSDPSPPEHYDATGEGASRFSYLDLPEPVAAADTDFNRGVSPKEFVAAANERFDLLDANHDGVLTRDELPHLGGARMDHDPQKPGAKHPPGQNGPNPR
ncbi:MAG TPA: EF-hand domain-containing protein [Sphingomonas sp.]|uniref:EF-hand domain-containing protein n=1 Tax=Sphingomonas sp. TaxID=28214 RepID=UPI002D10C381|nr:EF-hand domain-containing protein [Sphingomonas sp.]HMI18605.1 EF-hand domain-containing protein [Sphingomonas sp.]